MGKNYQNKMMTTDTGHENGQEVKIKRLFHFPDIKGISVSVEAENYDEALELATKKAEEKLKNQ